MIIGKILYQGKWLEVRESSSKTLSLSTGSFWIKRELYEDSEKFQIIYNEFCKKKLEEIIQEQIKFYKDKLYTIDIPYQTKSKRIIYKPTKISIREYLKKINYSTNIDFVVGKYTSEWGINYINTKQREFCLHFNLDLIKYDNYWKIKHVVAHELTHIYHRNHGPYFQKTLKTLDPYTTSAKKFFDGGLSNLFHNKNSTIRSNSNNSKLFKYLLIIIILFLGIYWLLQSSLFQAFNRSFTDFDNQNTTTTPKF